MKNFPVGNLSERCNRGELPVVLLKIIVLKRRVHDPDLSQNPAAVHGGFKKASLQCPTC